MKCPSCGYENSEDARYCGLCQTSFGSFAREPSAPYGLAPELKPKKEAVQDAQKVLRGGATGENWFKRHLNWTWVFASCGLRILAGVASIVCFYYVFGSLFELDINPVVMLMAVIAFVLIVLYLLATFGLGAWVLKRKNRSPLWLLILVIPFAVAFLSPLFSFSLSNWVPPWLPLLVGWLSQLVDILVIVCFLRLENRSELPALPVSSGPSAPSGYSGYSKSSSSIQPGLAPQGFGSQYGKYGP